VNDLLVVTVLAEWIRLNYLLVVTVLAEWIR
jgi:hypothetical protein